VSNVTVHPVAASDHAGEVEVFRADEAFLGSSSTTAGERSEGRVTCAPLDELLRGVEPASVTLLKVDVEGDEVAVLRGASRLLSGMRSGGAALVELAPSSAAAPGGESGVLKLMLDHGFTPFVLRNEYSGKRYADHRVTPPAVLEGEPSGWVDVLFVKNGAPRRSANL
jgi:Methyltransferase FkbM domain